MSSNDEGRVCYKRVRDDGRGFARFVDLCCFRDWITQDMKCETQEENGWLKFLYTLLTTIRFGVLVFGPLFFLSTVTGLVREEFPYSVALKEPLVKDVVVYRKNAGVNFAEHELKVIIATFCRAMRCISAAYVVMRCPSVCLSVRLSDTFVHSVETIKHFYFFTVG